MSTVDAHANSAQVRAALAAGIVGPLGFVLVFTVDGGLRPGYDPASMFVSELSIGPGGWVQKANFVVSGLLLVVFAVAACRTQPATRAARVAATAIAVAGAALAASGFATTDHAVMFTQLSPQGRVHGVLGAVFFLAIPVSCVAVAMAVGRDAARRPGRDATWRRITWAVAIAEIGGIAALKAAELSTSGLSAEKGLIQRACLILYLGWLAAFAGRLRRRARPTPPRPRTG